MPPALAPMLQSLLARRARPRRNGRTSRRRPLMGIRAQVAERRPTLRFPLARPAAAAAAAAKARAVKRRMNLKKKERSLSSG